MPSISEQAVTNPENCSSAIRFGNLSFSRGMLSECDNASWREIVNVLTPIIKAAIYSTWKRTGFPFAFPSYLARW